LSAASPTSSSSSRLRGVAIGWRTHARVGVPIIVLTLLLAALVSMM
jgi:hypothetical protein